MFVHSPKAHPKTATSTTQQRTAFKLFAQQVEALKLIMIAAIDSLSQGRSKTQCVQEITFFRYDIGAYFLHKEVKSRGLRLTSSAVPPATCHYYIKNVDPFPG